ncbi:MAG: hydrogenase maturation nickel metallochaperone HypA [Candidatus Lokiarchaeota archaeon]|nr:hydrogenase maturation nickel metallochaperone HypA [Candidatus Lokiarchaeota archaeon]
MHEFSMVNQIFRRCLQVARQNNATSLSEINIEIGDFALIVEIYAQQAFDALKKGTIAENAVLTIKRTPGILHCNSCNQQSEIWFNKEKEKAASEGRLEEYEEYEKAITEESLLQGNPNLGRNLFHCRKCNSSDTNLIEGKGVFIKNIRI